VGHNKTALVNYPLNWDVAIIGKLHLVRESQWLHNLLLRPAMAERPEPFVRASTCTSSIMHGIRRQAGSRSGEDIMMLENAFEISGQGDKVNND
jgi:hypothetical protein